MEEKFINNGKSFSSYVNTCLIDQYIEEGYLDYSLLEIPRQKPLMILNYTRKCTFEKKWDDVTLNCRGLVIQYDTGEVISRPFKKFFNDFEYSDFENTYRHKQYDVMQEKLDGVMIQAFVYNNEIYLATRGRFDSIYVKKAYELLTPELKEYILSDIMEGRTLIFELISPMSKILVDYKQNEYLGYLGAISINNGEYFPNVNGMFNGPVAYTGTDVNEQLNKFIQENDGVKYLNKEGYVLFSKEDNFLIKFKYDSYFRAKRIKINLTDKKIFEKYFVNAISDNVDVNTYLSNCDIYTEEELSYITRKLCEYNQRFLYMTASLSQISDSLKTMYSRKEVAIFIRNNFPLIESLIFNAFDDKFNQISATKKVIFEENQTLYIMRGPQGSGKSTAAKVIQQNVKNTIICSADDYFMVDGEYKFDGKLLPAAHSYCKNKAIIYLALGYNVVIDNTNILKKHYQEYVDFANMINVIVEVVEPISWSPELRIGDKWNYEFLKNKSVHNIPDEALKKAIDNYEYDETNERI